MFDSGLDKKQLIEHIRGHKELLGCIDGRWVYEASSSPYYLYCEFHCLPCDAKFSRCSGASHLFCKKHRAKSMVYFQHERKPLVVPVADLTARKKRKSNKR